MISYINELKRGFRDQHNFTPTGGTKNEPLFDNIPDGIYPMTLEGKLDYVVLKNGGIYCCNFSQEEAEKKFNPPVDVDGKSY